jgi:hypothetical protein
VHGMSGRFLPGLAQKHGCVQAVCQRHIHGESQPGKLQAVFVPSRFLRHGAGVVGIHRQSADLPTVRQREVPKLT